MYDNNEHQIVINLTISPRFSEAIHLLSEFSPNSSFGIEDLITSISFIPDMEECLASFAIDFVSSISDNRPYLKGTHSLHVLESILELGRTLYQLFTLHRLYENDTLPYQIDGGYGNHLLLRRIF